MAESEWDVVVVGAGIAGLCGAAELVAAGRRVLVLEKSRGVGGRMATRRIGDAVFDHGAQFFTIRGRAFGNVVGDAHRAGVVEKWCDGFPRGRSVEDGPPSEGDAADSHARWRGRRGMTDLPKRILETLSGSAAGGFELRTQSKVTAIGVADGCVRVSLEDGGPIEAAAAVVTAPAPQAIDLFTAGGLAGHADADAMRSLGGIAYDPCFTLMLVLDRPSLVPPPGGIEFVEGPVAWIADNHAKGVSPVPSLTVHASGAFSREHFDQPTDEVAAKLVEHARPWIDGDPAVVIRARALHRWKFALATATASSPLVAVSGKPPIVCCGDGFGGARVEAAASSGMAAARWVGRSFC